MVGGHVHYIIFNMLLSPKNLLKLWLYLANLIFSALYEPKSQIKAKWIWNFISYILNGGTF
jgi:hypothetical protein